MKTWKQHYELAERLLEAAEVDNSSRKDNLLRMAHVHALLATAKYDKYEAGFDLGEQATDTSKK